MGRCRAPQYEPPAKCASKGQWLWWTAAGLLVVAMGCYSAEMDARLGIGRGTVSGYIRLTDRTNFVRSTKGPGSQYSHLEHLSVSSEPGSPEFEAFASLLPEADRQAQRLLRLEDH